MSHYLSNQITIPSFSATLSHAIPAAIRPADAINPDPYSTPEPVLVYTFASKKQKNSKMKASKHIARSASTPQMREGPMSEEDKKRNKLGYQRISIACAHCRRRKIRCLVAEGDHHQRCQNCIRLKKECVFYPVDQQSAMESKSDDSSKPGVDSGPSSVVSSSSPIHGSERAFELSREFTSFPSLPSNAPGAYSSVPIESGRGRVPPETLIPRGFVHPEYGYRIQNEHIPSWNAPDGMGNTHQANMVERSESTSNAFWRNDQSRAPGDFAPFPSNSTQVSQSPQSAHPFAFVQHRNDSLWPQMQQPLRSMSYGNIEGHSGQASAYSTAFLGQPVPMQYAAPSMDHNPTLMLQEPAPQASPVRPHQQSFGQSHPFMYQQHDNSSVSGASLDSHQAYSGNWYPDASSFESLEEEPDNYGTARQQRPG